MTAQAQYGATGGVQPQLGNDFYDGFLVGAGSSVLEAPFVGFGLAETLGAPGALYLSSHTALLGTFGNVILYPPSTAANAVKH